MSDSLCAPQARRSFGSEETQQSSPRYEEEQEEEEEDEPPVPMTTRLRKQAEREREREREQEREQEQRMTETISVSDGEEEDVGRPSQWNVEQVFSYINSLPGTAVTLTHTLTLKMADIAAYDVY